MEDVLLNVEKSNLGRGAGAARVARYHLRYQTPPLGLKRQRPSEEGLCNQRFILAPRPGLEPGTCGLTVRRSTN